MPFGVWVDALDAYVASQDLERRARLGRASCSPSSPASCPSLRRAGRDAGRGARRRALPRAPRGARRCSSGWPRDKPLVLVLDDLHWSDGASIELIAALLRRGPARAGAARARPSGPGRRPSACAAALAVADVGRLELGQLSEARGGRAAGRRRPRGAGGDLPRTAAATRSTSSSSRGRASGARCRRRAARRRARGRASAACRPPSRPSLAEELASLSPPARDAARRRRRRRRAVRARPGGGDRRARRRPTGLDALDELLARDLVRPTQVPRRFVFRHPARAPRGLRVDAAAAGGSRPTRAPPRRSQQRGAARRRARPPRRAVGRPGRRGRRSRCCSRPGRRPRRARRRPPRAGSRPRCGCCPRPTASARRSCASSLASAQRSLGELERCRETLLEAIELLPADGRRAAGRADRPLRGRRALAGPPRRGAPPAHRAPGTSCPTGRRPRRRRCRSSWPSTASTSSTSSRRSAMGRAALRDRARRSATARCIAAAAAALALGEASAGEIEAAREHRDEALAEIDRLSDAELAPRLEALYYLGWAENYLEHYDEAIAHVDRGIAIARATGEGRLLVPMMLVKGYPFEMQGRLAEAIELCETAVEAARAGGQPPLPVLGAVRAGLGALLLRRPRRARSRPARRARASAAGWPAARCPPPAAGRAGRSACACFELGELERALDDHARALAATSSSSRSRSSAASTGRSSRWPSWRSGSPRPPRSYVRRAERQCGRRSGCSVPAAVAGRTRAAVLLATGEPAEAAAGGASARSPARPPSARALQAAFSRALAGHGAGRGGRPRGRRSRRCARPSASSTAAARSAPRDEVRRELRKLGARAEARGPATGEDAGVARADQARARDRRAGHRPQDQQRDRRASCSSASKTIESHLRNIFVKLGVSSRVEVARAVERERREHAETA